MCPLSVFLTPIQARNSSDVAVSGDPDYGRWQYPQSGNRRINAMRGATVGLASKLLNPNPIGNQVGAITWSDAVVAQQPLTNDYNVIRGFLGSMIAYAYTNSTSGLNAAKTMGDANFRPGTVHVVILLTDGVNDSYTSGTVGLGPRENYTTINRQALRYVTS